MFHLWLLFQRERIRGISRSSVWICHRKATKDFSKFPYWSIRHPSRRWCSCCGEYMPNLPPIFLRLLTLRLFRIKYSSLFYYCTRIWMSCKQVMRLEAGGSLDKLLHPPKGATIPLTTLDKLTLLSKITLALADLHESGCVHGDLVRFLCINTSYAARSSCYS